jgi:hypothetical protein
MMVAANGNGAAQKNYVAAHLSQRKLKWNQLAINRFVPGEMIFLEPTRAGGEQLFARSKHSSQMHQILWFKPSHHMFVREHVRRVEVGIESGREEIEGEDAISGPEIEGRFEGCGKADGEAIAGADSARWSDGFRASGMVYPSALTCARGEEAAKGSMPPEHATKETANQKAQPVFLNTTQRPGHVENCPQSEESREEKRSRGESMAASKWRLSACSGCTCPGFSRTSSTSSWSTTIFNQARVYRRHKVHVSRQGSNPATLLPSHPHPSPHLIAVAETLPSPYP